MASGGIAVVFLGADGFRDERMDAIGADHDPRTFFDGSAVTAVPLMPMTRSPSSMSDSTVKFSRSSTPLSTAASTSSLVEDRAAWTEAAAAAVGVDYAALERERADVEDHVQVRSGGQPVAASLSSSPQPSMTSAA